jgi:hypothetical protein
LVSILIKRVPFPEIVTAKNFCPPLENEKLLICIREISQIIFKDWKAEVIDP